MTQENKNEGRELAIIDYDVTEESLCAIEQQWEKVPDCTDKKGYELVRVGLGNVKKMRVGVEKKRKELKAESLEYGRRVDATAKAISARLETVEGKLFEAKKEVDEAKLRAKLEKERIEKDRVDSIKSKISKIEKAATVQYGTPLLDIESRFSLLESMEICKDEFEEFYAEAHAMREASMSALRTIIASERTRIEAEKEAEEKRARIEEQQRIERERLEKEKAEQASILAEREAKIEAERKAFEEEKRIREEAERKEREAREAKEKAEREKREAAEAAEREAKDKVEREAREAEEDRLRIIREAEEEKIAEERRQVAEECRRLEEERQKVEAEKEKQRLAAEEEERRKIEEEERNLNEEFSQKNIDDALAVLQDMDTDNELRPESILSAVIAGKVPNMIWVG